MIEEFHLLLNSIQNFLEQPTFSNVIENQGTTLYDAKLVNTGQISDFIYIYIGTAKIYKRYKNKLYHLKVVKVLTKIVARRLQFSIVIYSKNLVYWTFVLLYFGNI